MDIRIRKREQGDPRYDNCGNIAEIILNIDSIRIPFCSRCYENLKNEILYYNFHQNKEQDN